MQYAFLIFDREGGYENLSAGAREALHSGHTDLVAKLDASGITWSGRQLAAPATATTIRSTDGTDRVVSDGPYSETKEHLGGYYLVDVADLDAALSWAGQIPLLAGTAVEVRPVVEM